MTPEDVISLGWKEEHKNSRKDPTQTFAFPTDPQYDQYIISVSFVKKEKRHRVMICLVSYDRTFNEWGKSETHFYGRLETKEDLLMIMKFLDIIEV